MKKKDDGPRRAATTKTRSPVPTKQQREQVALKANGGLTAKQVLAMWELIITGDSKIAAQRSVRLEQPDVQRLVKAGLVTIEHGPNPKLPGRLAKLHVTDKGWAWANQQGLAVHVPSVQATAIVFQALLAKIEAYLQINQLGLHQVLAPRSPASAPEPAAAAEATLEARIRAAYLLATDGVMNQHIKLARLRAALHGEPAEAVNEELRRMQQRGSALLYPIDDPQRLRPEDEAAAMRVAGERRDLVCIRG